jgi:hypothetical protein
MLPEGNIEYALTRVQSQFARRPVAGDWHRLEGSHDLGQYLEGARSGIFGSWIASLDRSRDAHAIERVLRDAWRRYVRTVASWHPRCWQAWLIWIEWLPTLGLMAQLGDSGSVPQWLAADAVLAPATRDTRAERLSALKGTQLEVFEPAISGATPIGELWLLRWRKLMPATDADTERHLAAVVRAVRDHLRCLELDGADATALRDQLRGRLRRLFRLAAGTPVATLCHLALVALDMERLRGGLINRALFAGGG